MVTIEEIPGKISLSRHPIIVRLKTDLIDECRPASFVINRNSIEEDWFFSVDGVPGQLSAYNTTQPFNLQSIADHYQSNPLIGEFFELVSATGGSYLSALLVFTACQCRDLGTIITNLDSGESLPNLQVFEQEEIEDNHRFFVRIQCYDEVAEKWTTAGTSESDADKDGCAEIDLSGIIDDCLSCPTPILERSKLRKRTESIKEFRVLVWEEYSEEGETVQSESVVSDRFFAMKGGVDEKIISPEDFLSEEIRFLDYFDESETIPVTPIQPLGATFLFCPNTNASVYSVALYKDAKGQTLAASPSLPIPVAAGEVCVVDAPVGLCSTGNNVDPCRVASICVEIYRQNLADQLLLSREYVVQPHKTCYTYFSYQNSLCGIGSIAVEGNRTVRAKTTSRTAQTLDCKQHLFKKDSQLEIQIDTYPYPLSKSFEIEQLTCADQVVEVRSSDVCECPGCDDLEYCEVIFSNGSYRIGNKDRTAERYRLRYQARQLRESISRK